MTSYILEHIDVTWMAFGILLLFLELSSIPGIGLFFAGLAAICVGGLIAFEYLLPQKYILQFVWFFVLTIGWAVVLWVPMKRLRYKTSDKDYQNITGSFATVKKAPLVKGKSGKVSWSGTTMKARIVNDSDVDEIPVGTEVEIVEVKGNTLIVKSK